LRIQQPAP
jgi:Prephenate dehydratase